MSQSRLAILLILLCNALYAVGYALARLLSDSLDPLQITFLRYALVLGGAFTLSLAGRHPVGAWRRALVPARPWAQRAAAAMLVVSTAVAVWGYALVPVTEAAALGFTAPILTVAMGMVVLHERVSAIRWVAVLCGFAGMLLVLRPDGALFRWAALVPVAAAMMYALYQVMARDIRGVADSVGMTVQGGLVGTILLTPLAALVWRMPDAATAGLVLMFVAAQTGGLLALAAAVRRAEVSALAPWHYARLFFALAMDAALFGRMPDSLALAGCGLIAAGGLLLLWRGGGMPARVHLPGRAGE
ncbi:DMT family transporter [Plastoroseomonas arctica]|uniref:EamA family transporter n=1 Tax=Plastoroseomonas arctica TaxID=1509237 RepID=A0AAF1K3W5_9PROT|nr:EamA family transporter [Plastoroseomonas arctica]MBR0655340.1 EamA family transporter [Plastoroseomonas arctica]